MCKEKEMSVDWGFDCQMGSCEEIKPLKQAIQRDWHVPSAVCPQIKILLAFSAEDMTAECVKL